MRWVCLLSWKTPLNPLSRLDRDSQHLGCILAQDCSLLGVAQAGCAQDVFTGVLVHGMENRSRS